MNKATSWARPSTSSGRSRLPGRNHLGRWELNLVNRLKHEHRQTKYFSSSTVCQCHDVPDRRPAPLQALENLVDGHVVNHITVPADEKAVGEGGARSHDGAELASVEKAPPPAFSRAIRGVPIDP